MWYIQKAADMAGGMTYDRSINCLPVLLNLIIGTTYLTKMVIYCTVVHKSRNKLGLKPGVSFANLLCLIKNFIFVDF